MVGKSLDLDKLEALFKLAKQYKVTYYSTEGLNFNMEHDEPKPQLEFQKQEVETVSDEEILMNPYAGMFANQMPKKG